MRRIWHPYWDWEDWKAGMWRSITSSERKTLLPLAIEFTGNAILYGSYMRRVIVEWPKSCEQNLTEPSINRLAWVGHAAACMAIQAPEDVTRQAWGFLSAQQQSEADDQAEATVREWIDCYAEKNRQLHLSMGAPRISVRNTGRGRPKARSVMQSSELSGYMSRHYSE